MKFLLLTIFTAISFSAFTQDYGVNIILARGVTMEQVKKTLFKEGYKLYDHYAKADTVLTKEKKML